MPTANLPDEISRHPAHDTYPQKGKQAAFLSRTLLVVGIVVLATALIWLLWQVRHLILLIFGGVLLGVFLRGLAGGAQRIAPLSDAVALALVLILLVVLVGGTVWLLGPHISSQFSQMSQDIGSPTGAVRQSLSEYSWGQQLLAWLPPLDQIMARLQNRVTAGVFSSITGIASRTADILTTVLVILFTGLFFAFNPGLYMRGVVQLFPHDKRERVWEVLQAEEHVLRGWLIGTAISMTVAGALSGAALWLLGVPLALTLGLLMGIFEFVPYAGPLLATVPAALMAFTVGPQTVLWVLLAYEAVQILESNIILPLILKQTADIPPVVTLGSQVLFGTLTGGLGLLLAAPLAAGILTLIRMVYIHDILGDPEYVKESIG